MTSKAVCLLSGGLDSAVAAALWLDAGNPIALCLTFDYGHRAAEPEFRSAKAFAAARDLPWRGIELPWLAELAREHGCALTDAKALPEGPGDERSAAAVWVPARNTVFCAVAAAHAETLGAEAVLAGFNREEAATFPDNSADFVAAGTAFFALGTRSAVRLESPTLQLDKPQLVAQARRLGIAQPSLWSCYDRGPEPCGRCESCVRSARAWS